ncbi:MAG TPA: glycosyltransferase [Rhodanobacteraceae bacterium]
MRILVPTNATPYPRNPAPDVPHAAHARRAPVGTAAERLRVQILARDNGAGLSNDIDLLRRTLEQLDCEVTVTIVGHYHSIKSRIRRLHGISNELYAKALRSTRYRFDVNMMLERVCPGYFCDARYNVFVPNPEWVRGIWLKYLCRFNLVFAKTRHAVPLFRNLHVATLWTGWASLDRLDHDVHRERVFLHTPGLSNTKGTQRLLKLWARHPAWPTLHVVWRSHNALSATVPDNVHLMTEHLGEARLRALQNRCAFHVCPSRTEGYGHYIAEALSVGAVCVTTNAAPMNELVTPARGVLVAAKPAGRQNLGTLFDFDNEAMCAAVERCLAMPHAELASLGNRARQWFEANASAFPERIAGALQRLTAR